MDKRALIVLGIVFGGLFVVFFGFLSLALLAADGAGSLRSRKGPKIGVIEITDVIMDSKDILEDLKAFREDEEIKGILVRIDSPGGAVAPSQEIHDAILRTKKKKKVVVSMASVAASGGYYIAVAADEIVANPGTVTGSIGVITQFTNLKGLAQWAMIDVETIKSGPLKDAGNPFRDMTDDEREYWQALVMNIYDQFLTAVAEGRGIDKEVLRPLADGRVLTGQQAHEANLIDMLGGFEAAVDRLAELAEIEDPVLIYPAKDDEELLRELLTSSIRAFTGGVRKELVRAAVSPQPPRLWLLPPTH